MKSTPTSIAPDDDLGALMTPREAARMVRVSVGFLRASSCPKVLLRGNGGTGKVVVRDRRADVLEWIAAQTVNANHPQHRRS